MSLRPVWSTQQVLGQLRLWDTVKKKWNKKITVYQLIAQNVWWQWLFNALKDGSEKGNMWLRDTKHYSGDLWLMSVWRVRGRAKNNPDSWEPRWMVWEPCNFSISRNFPSHISFRPGELWILHPGTSATGEDVGCIRVLRVLSLLGPRDLCLKVFIAILPQVWRYEETHDPAIWSSERTLVSNAKSSKSYWLRLGTHFYHQLHCEAMIADRRALLCDSRQAV